MKPTRHPVTLSEIQLSYLEWNRGKEPLLLLHGLGDHAGVWSSLGESLSDRYHVIAPDMRGHGYSSKPITGYKASDAIADLEGLLDHLRWQSANVLAHSWSAKIAPIWAKEQPQRFQSLILVDPIFITKMPSIMKLSFPILYRTLDCLKMMGPFASYEAAQLQAQELAQFAGWSPLQQAVFKEGIEEKPNGQWGSKFTIAARDGIFEDVLRVAGLTEPLFTPTLLIQPEQGVNRAEWQIKPYKTYLKNLTLCRIPGNHWPFLGQTEAFNGIVADFLTGVSGKQPVA
jgi:pimeloyl-ACP methyl ester carboxylesterase